MSYASVESIKGQYNLDEARERSRGGLEIASLQADASMYGADQTLAGTERKAQADEFGASKSLEASMYGADQTLRGRLAPSFSYSESRAKGGLVAAARPYLVGEKGPELMVPDQSGTIVPNHRLQAILKRKAIPRAEGGRVNAEGIVTQNLADWRAGAAPHAEYKKNLMAAATNEKIREMEAGARIDPQGYRTRNLAESQAPNRVEDDVVRTDRGNQFNEFYKANTGAAAVPKVGEPDFPDYHGAHEVARNIGPKEAEAFHHDSQKIKQYRPLFTPESVAAYHGIAPDKAAGFIDELAKNPADYRRYMLQNGPALQKKAPAAAAPAPGTSADPAVRRLQNMDRDFRTSTTRGVELFNRGVRQVVPGSSTFINEKGQVQNPF